VLVSDDEEENRRLLSDSLTASPNKQNNEEVGGLNSNGTDKYWAHSNRRKSLVTRDSHYLSFGQAEKTFLTMSGALAGSSSRNSKERTPVDDKACDTVTKVPDSIEVVKHILSELEAQNDNTSDSRVDDLVYSDREVDDCSSNGDLTFVTCQEECDSKLTPDRACKCSREVVGLVEYPGTRGSLVVDVHHGDCNGEGGRRCSKHTAERFPRCYSESHRQSDRQTEKQLGNLDTIEMVGEDRMRHFSESAAGRRHRAATFSTEIRNIRRSMLLGRNRKAQVSEGSSKLVDRCRSQISLQSEVKFDIWNEQESEESSEFGEVNNSGELNECDVPSNFEQLPQTSTTSFHFASCIPASLSNSSSTSSMPICRICQLPGMEPSNPLLSPCRCLGSIRYVHGPCLKKWLEVSSKKSSDPPGCELCQYQYIRHKKFMISNWLVPSCSSKDKVLHSIFMVAVVIMIGCSIITIICFKQNADIQPRVGPDTELSASELMTLSCGVLFFLSFFVAMYVEVKAENTIYQLICKFFNMNHEWTIEEYDRRKDPAKQIDFP